MTVGVRNGRFLWPILWTPPPKATLCLPASVADIDMNLDDSGAAESSFTDDNHTPNMWTIDETPDEKSKKDSEEDKHGDIFVGHNLEDELEKPSFLRRLTRRGKDADKEEDKE